MTREQTVASGPFGMAQLVLSRREGFAVKLAESMSTRSSTERERDVVAPEKPALKERPVMTDASHGERDKAIKILAKSIFRELKMNGYETRQIVALSSELLGLVTSNIKTDVDDHG